MLSSKFNEDLKRGVLEPLLREVQEDDTLLLGVRNGYISVYYRGGQLLKVEADGASGYKVTFDSNHDKSGVLPGRFARHGCADVLTQRLRSVEDTAVLVDVLSEVKRVMDRSPKLKSALEREFQQVAARVNSRARSANSSHYFVTDIEHASDNARFDMLGVRWKHDERSNRSRLVPVLFEVKYGVSSLAGGAGIVDHLEKTLTQLALADFRARLAANVESQFNQLADLQLLTFNRGTSTHKFSVVDDHVQIVFLLAEYVPHSSQLKPMLDECDKKMRVAQESLAAAGVTVDLRFACGSLCGYAMYDCTMLSTDGVRKLLSAWEPVN
ncbi:hypothetical protein CNR27_00245 [Luteimonas chenhongjianii]|uniref:Uncharacterized protein n=1 Tax=Luteimonas chenhongjianii TaxID=2006110 RepID=A0A290XAI7_9GAMM|nr:hypothetical protein CNR27_00245 [Luteimonas chenhongjianii]